MTQYLVPLSFLLLAGCDLEEFDNSSRFTEDFHYNYALKPGGRVSVETFNGSVEIYGWDKDQVEIDGTKYASAKDRLSLVRVDATGGADSVQIRISRPEGGNGNVGNMGAKLRMHVPARTILERVKSSNGPLRIEGIQGRVWLKTSNGPVRLTRVQGDAEVGTSNGPVELSEFTGALEVSTSNGPITVQASTLDAARGMRLKTSNGPISVRLPATVTARVKANTSNGRVTSDFALNGGEGDSKSHMEGMIGAGGALLDLQTSNGPIRIAKN